MELTDKQWTRLEPIILQSVCKKDSRGRKLRDPREVLNGILWVLRTGTPWKDLPDRYPPHQTCHRRFQQWTKAGLFRRIIEELMIAPHRRNRTKPKTQDGRKLRRYQRRWKVERLFAWLHNFRRLVVRYERHADNFLAFLLLECSVILLRSFLR